ncbi:hypothetical protein [Archangium lansingense]|uniref:Uncharacterized protein n=1 Tax=Archangium lansingense TaxID=2995310 RepID=A0ABT4ACB0_9BACT|nr:hypothetical protein [Archangium lansinium]MCY1079302.1 hypothetical protein [Archangium lansinium]
MAILPLEERAIMDDTAASTPPRRVVAASELQSGKRRIAPRGMLWAKLQRVEATLLLRRWGKWFASYLR